MAIRLNVARAGIATAVVCGFLIPGAAPSAAPADPLVAIDRSVAAAEQSLRRGELEIAESRYRSILKDGWMLAGSLAAADGQLTEATDAFRRAYASAVDAGDARRLLAIALIQQGQAREAVTLLSGFESRASADLASRRVLAQALAASGQLPQAVQELEEARATAPDDLELTFALASGYLQIKKIDAAEKLFAAVAAARPLPQTDMLIGRAYRDAGEYARARPWFEAALKKDPAVRHAHYYLGTLAIRPDGVLDLDAAIVEFDRELQLAPDDPIANLRLGMALVELHRSAEAAPRLDLAVRAPAAPAVAFYYIGRNQLDLDRPAEAVAAFRRALDLAKDSGASGAQIGSIHYQLGVALRGAGSNEEAAAEFAEAEKLAVARSESERQRLTRYLTDAPDPQHASTSIASVVALPDTMQLAERTPAERAEIKRRLMPILARANLNLGIMHVQGGRFLRAAEFFAETARIDPLFPQVQYSLGVAYFNAQRYSDAAAALSHALDTDPRNVTVRRMLGLALLNSDGFDRAVALLQDDPERSTDPSIQYAYGLALVRGGRTAEAETAFLRLLADHADTPELSVVLGHAYAQDGNYELAIEALRRALQLKPDIADANAALGLIYLKQGKLDDAERAFRAELQAHASNVKARGNLATVLDMLGRPDEALTEVRAALGVRPDLADARYLIGKLLLQRGSADQAAGHLEAAVRLAPDDANVHFQLARAYEKLGRTELSSKELEIYQQLKEKRRGKTP